MKPIFRNLVALLIEHNPALAKYRALLLAGAAVAGYLLNEAPVAVALVEEVCR